MASINTASLLETIASLEKQLVSLKSQLGVSGAELSLEKKPKKKRAVNPDAKPNPWIQFLKKVQAAIKESETKGPATIGVLFAQHLKENGGKNADEKPAAYEMEDDAIKAAFTEWATPERIEHAKSLKRGKKEKADSSSEVEAEPAAAEEPEKPVTTEEPEKKKRAPMSEEAKAKAKAKREATKAAKGAKKEYSLAELQDWDEVTIDGEDYGVNKRGDVINSDGDFVGHWDGKKLDTEAEKPADWDKVMA